MTRKNSQIINGFVLKINKQILFQVVSKQLDIKNPHGIRSIFVKFRVHVSSFRCSFRCSCFTLLVVPLFGLFFGGVGLASGLLWSVVLGAAKI